MQIWLDISFKTCVSFPGVYPFDNRLTIKLKSCVEIDIEIQDQDSDGRHLGPGLSGLGDKSSPFVSIERAALYQECKSASAKERVTLHSWAGLFGEI
jgi:hypothetical protein